MIKAASALLSLALVASCSSYDRPETVALDRFTLSGTVVALDAPSRQLTVQDATGNEVQVQADASVTNFDQIRVGDVLEVDYLQAVTVAIERAGSDTPGAYVDHQDGTSKPGRKPGIGMQDVVTVVAPVLAIDTARHTLTVKGPEGDVVSLDVREPDHQAMLGKIKIGDLLRVSFTEATAVSVRAKS